MDVKEAVRAAKNYVTDLLSEESLKNIGLEEVKFNQRTREWNVTIGFSRPWDFDVANPSRLTENFKPGRDYRMVTIKDGTGELVSLTRRDS